MKLKIQYQQYPLNFRFLAKTSRGSMRQKPTYFISIENALGVKGLGECSTIGGLSPDASPDYESKLKSFLRAISMEGFSFENLYQLPDIEKFPSILFGLETAMLDLANGGKRIIFQNDFSKGLKPLPINGLVWMGEQQQMEGQMLEKAGSGFGCMKLKIGGIDFEQECFLLEKLRKLYPQIIIRLDANGAFSPNEALHKLEKLSAFGVHSIEQPIKAGQFAAMAKICQESPIPIALDEELIGVTDSEQKKELLATLKPQYIILKPSLLGGIKHTAEWIQLAEKQSIQWWNTSALEANIGLNAIAQFTAEYPITLPQGLGTGMLYNNNVESPLSVEAGNISYLLSEKWDFSGLAHNWVSA